MIAFTILSVLADISKVFVKTEGIIDMVYTVYRIWP